jgi:predicted acylesterase/phospholipase RssA
MQIPGSPIIDVVPVVPPQQIFPVQPVDGVFEGGGALGTAYVGALRVLEDSQMWFRRVAGNSAGAITAAMVAAGFTAREIEALSSAFGPAGSLPRSLTELGFTEPIKFAAFLDLPTADSISTASKRKTVLWHALNGTVLDVIGDIDVPVPTQDAAVTACAQAILGFPALGNVLRGAGLTDELEGVLDAALAILPDDQLHVRDFLPDTTTLRRALADAMWDAFAAVWPTLAMLTNLTYEGSIFEGDRFLAVISEMLGRKVHRNPAASVQFSDLKIPLAVIASNIDTGEMEVYDSKRFPNMIVAEAIRRSMSIPFVFQPRGANREIVDGGLSSNFPIWLFTEAAHKYWPTASIDDQRLKIGFLLDESAAPRRADGQAGRFPVTGTPPRVDVGQVLQPLLKKKLVELGYPADLVDVDLRRWFGGTVNGQRVLPEMELIEQVLGVSVNGVMKTEESTRTIITRALMAGMDYIEIVAPLLGFHALDFGVNEDRPKVRTMWDRTWREASRELALAKARGVLPARTLFDPSRSSPFD